jgi:hypothetical protein
MRALERRRRRLLLLLLLRRSDARARLRWQSRWRRS